MSYCDLGIKITLGKNTYENSSPCREILLFSWNDQQFDLGEYSKRAGDLSLNKTSLDVYRLEAGSTDLVRKYHPNFKYIIEKSRVVIPEQGFSALEGHAILGALRDGPGEVEEFFLYLVSTLQKRKPISFENAHAEQAYNGPSSWSRTHFSIKTLWEVCQTYKKRLNFPTNDENFSTTDLARTHFRVYFLSQKSLVSNTKKALACSICGKEDVFRLLFTQSQIDNIDPEKEPWLLSSQYLTFRHQRKTNQFHVPLTVGMFSGLRVDTLVYSAPTFYALGTMLIQGEST